MSNSRNLTNSFASRLGIPEEKVLRTLMNTAFSNASEVVTEEQTIALMVVAEQYNLNPFTKEIYAYPSNAGIVPVVGVDGWNRIINEHGAFDGVSFNYSENMVTPDGTDIPCPEWIEVTIHRKDRTVPTTIREYLDEVYRSPSQSKKGYIYKGPWQTHPKRMLRHKGLIQCARIAFSFGGIFDEDEADRIIDMGQAEVVEAVEKELDTQPQPPKKVSANKTLSDEEIKVMARKLIDRVKKYESWQIAYDYIASSFCDSTKSTLNELLKAAEKEAKAMPLSADITEATLNVQPEQNEPHPVQPDLVPEPEQTAFTDGIGF